MTPMLTPHTHIHTYTPGEGVASAHSRLLTGSTLIQGTVTSHPDLEVFIHTSKFAYSQAPQLKIMFRHNV